MRWEVGGGGAGTGVPRLLCLSNGSRCYAVYLAKNGSVALSSKSRRHSVFNFSACRHLACIITQALYEPSEANAAFCARREKRGEEKNKAL